MNMSLKAMLPLLCLVFSVAALLLWVPGARVLPSASGTREGSQVHQLELPTGDVLVNETHFTHGWQDGQYTSSTLAIRWKKTGELEQIAAATGILPNVQHVAIATNEEHLVIATGGKVFFRKRGGNKGQWNTWRLNSSPEIYGFIRDYLESHFPGSFTTNHTSEGESLQVPGNFAQNEYPMTIYPSGTAAMDFEYCPPKLFYEVEKINLSSRRLWVVPFAKNHRLPRLVFAEENSFGTWKFDMSESIKENERASK